MKAFDMDYDERDEYIDFLDDSGAGDEEFTDGYGADYSDDFNDGEFW